MRFDTPYNQRTVPPHHGTDDSSKSYSTAGARKWNSWWSRRSPNIKTNDLPPTCIGIDAGSKTLKLVTLDETGEIVHGLYHRHRSDVRTSLSELIHEFVWRYGDLTLPIAITGSAGIALAEALGIPFVQEVVATSNSVKARYPQADCIVELGGEDAKITYLSGTPEQRMNASCAGGTGDFIDGIASMLGCKTREISKLALGSQRTYPIASRCAVFAQTDVRPLINAGVSKADIAQSALEAVVNQTLGGLACGRPIRGNVVFLGGPLEHIPALLMAFKRQLGLTREQCIKPPDAHLFTAMGAILTASEPPVVTLSELERRIGALEPDDAETGAFEPLFRNEREAAAFVERHRAEVVLEKRIEDTSGPLYLGFDAGSTTMKYALVDAQGALVSSDYRTVDGDTFKTAREMLAELTDAIESGNRFGQKRFIARAAVTGYGEDLLRAAFGFDAGVVETIAHLKAAQHFHPDVSFMLDIGGQDMKALWIRDGVVVDAVLNEACSSGCGAFVQSCAKSLALSHDEFSREALLAARPIDLGAKCTVFMTSRVRHAQKTGTPTGDIAAGVAYSIAHNVASRLIGSGNASSLGDTVVVQGGAFKSDAVLRAFEKVADVHAIRPNIAHLMGAFGAALVARQLDEDARASTATSLLPAHEIRALDPKRSSARCAGCGNACKLSIVEFGNGRRYITGNRCERAAEILFGQSVDVPVRPPNVVELEQKLIGAFGDKRVGAFAIGIMNTMNTYESMPFWHTLFTQLGFSVTVPDAERTFPLKSRARETIPSESACYPAKLSHARYAALVDAGADAVFMPRFERGTRCPVASLYADALRSSVEEPRLAAPSLKSIRPRKIACNPDDRASLLKQATEWDPSITATDFDRAIEAALASQRSFEDKIRLANERALHWLEESSERRAVVLAMRPYHTDPELLHDIDRELARLGFAVIPQLGFPSSPSDKPLWPPSKNLVALVEQAAGNEQVEVVALRSFGCGYDAVSFDEARDRAQALHRPFTELKIDEIADIAHVRIRLRTLAYTSRERKPAGEAAATGTRITPDLCSTAKALVESVIAAIADDDTELAGDARASIADKNNGADESSRTLGCELADDLENASDRGRESAQSSRTRLRIPRACLNCLTGALPFELAHLGIEHPPLEEQSLRKPERHPAGGMKVGLLGNPLLVFNPELNDGIEGLLDELGCEAVLPEPELVEVEDVRYLEQLEAFQRQGVERVIYLQSFGCLKGHVQSRGALRDLARQFPEMPITVVDYDPESSALNRENRIRLAVSR